MLCLLPRPNNSASSRQQPSAASRICTATGQAVVEVLILAMFVPKDLQLLTSIEERPSMTNVRNRCSIGGGSRRRFVMIASFEIPGAVGSV